MKSISLAYKIKDNLSSYPGDEPLSLKILKTHDSDGYHLSHLSQSLHTGTHIDLPNHMILSDKTFDDYPITTFINECIMIENDASHIKYIKEGYHLIVRFNHTTIENETYFKDYPVLNHNIIEEAIHKKVPMIALNTPSPDYYPFESHKRLFNHNILILENVTNLNQLPLFKPFKLIAIPLNIDAEASLVNPIAQIHE